MRRDDSTLHCGTYLNRADSRSEIARRLPAKPILRLIYAGRANRELQVALLVHNLGRNGDVTGEITVPSLAEKTLDRRPGCEVRERKKGLQFPDFF